MLLKPNCLILKLLLGILYIRPSSSSATKNRMYGGKGGGKGRGGGGGKGGGKGGGGGGKGEYVEETESV